jgi:predicted amidohydrolase
MHAVTGKNKAGRICQTLNIVSVQIKPKKGDYEQNLNLIAEAFAQADSMETRPDVMVFPETALSGYFLEGGVREAARTRQELFADLLHVYKENTHTPNTSMDVITGFYEISDGKYHNAGLYAVLSNGHDAPRESRIVHVHHKFFLPTYGVFDEKRFVARGRTIGAFDTGFGKAAILICEDVWHSISAAIAALKGAQIIYVLSASPGREFSGEDIGNLARWKTLLPSIAEEHNVFVVYSGLVGFEGGKGFTGSSCIIDPWGRTRIIGPATNECFVQAEIDMEDIAISRSGTPLLADLEAALSDLSLELEAIAKKPHHI